MIFLSISAHAIGPIKNNDDDFIKSLGLNKEQILKLEEIEKQKSLKTNNALRLSREYKLKNTHLTKQECNKYTSELLRDIQKDYEKELSKSLNPVQKYRYLDYKSRVY